MSWYSGLENILERDVRLTDHTTFRIGGRADIMLVPQHAEQFALAYGAAMASGLEVRILGRGSNLLVADQGVRGVVISTRRMCKRSLSEDKRTLEVEAGVDLRTLVRWTARKGLEGLEFLAGIPGSVGGAVASNAGTRDGAMSQCVTAVWCATRDGDLYRYDSDLIHWEYRHTSIKDPIVRVELELKPADADALLDWMSDALIRRHSAQPVGIPSAGCFFKNPLGDRSAGYLIDDVGLKGASVGGAAVSAKHANFIINKGGASAADVFQLYKIVRERVHMEHDVLLENEVRFWPAAS